MKSWYYYYRNGRREPLITVCLLKDGDTVARGISICSPSEFPSKKDGRKKAYSNARRALGTKRTSMLINREEARFTVCNVNCTGDKIDILEFDSNGFCVNGHKSYFNPKLSIFETRLVSKENK